MTLSMEELKGREHLVMLKVDAGVLFDALKKMNGDTSSLGGRLVSLLMGDDSFQTGVGLGIYGISEVDTDERLATLQAENEKLRECLRPFAELAELMDHDVKFPLTDCTIIYSTMHMNGKTRIIRAGDLRNASNLLKGGE